MRTRQRPDPRLRPLRVVLIFLVDFWFICPTVVGQPAAVESSSPASVSSNGLASVALIRGALVSYVRAGRFGGFYDFRDPDQALKFNELDPATIDLPADAWPTNTVDGFGAFLAAVKELDKYSSQPGATASARAAIFSALLKVLDDYPFAQAQAYFTDASSRTAPPRPANNIFIQYMSRRLLLATLAFQPGLDRNAERQRMAASMFPQTPNGRAGAALLEKHGVLLAGFGIRDDVVPAVHQTALNAHGWKSTKGSPHSGGIFDYAHFTDDYLAEVSNLLDLIPPHLIAVGGSSKPLSSITCHGYNYIYEMEDFAEKYFPADADSRGWLGYLHGQTLNVFGLAKVPFSSGVTQNKFRTNEMTNGPRITVSAHDAMVTVVHEVTHYMDATIARKRPDLAARLRRITDLGVREQSNIRAIDSNIRDFAGSGQAAYMWFQKVPQEMVATAANVVSVAPLAVLDWCQAIARGTNGVIGPLNHFLWFVDVHSLDGNFRETSESFLLTLQPGGQHFRRIVCPLRRDAQDRIEEVTVSGRHCALVWDAEGFAHLAEEGGR